MWEISIFSSVRSRKKANRHIFKNVVQSGKLTKFFILSQFTMKNLICCLDHYQELFLLLAELIKPLIGSFDFEIAMKGNRQHSYGKRRSSSTEWKSTFADWSREVTSSERITIVSKRKKKERDDSNVYMSITLLTWKTWPLQTALHERWTHVLLIWLGEHEGENTYVPWLNQSIMPSSNNGSTAV